MNVSAPPCGNHIWSLWSWLHSSYSRVRSWLEYRFEIPAFHLCTVFIQKERAVKPEHSIYHTSAWSVKVGCDPSCSAVPQPLGSCCRSRSGGELQSFKSSVFVVSLTSVLTESVSSCVSVMAVDDTTCLWTLYDSGPFSRTASLRETDAG